MDCPLIFLDDNVKCRLITNDGTDPNNEIYLNSVHYFLKQLIGKIEYNHVKVIDIKMNAVMHDDGECFITRLKDKTIKIRLKMKGGMNFVRTITTIAHECVHAKQYITKELKHNEFGDWLWKGKNYGVNPYKGLTLDQTYKKLPWEKEAIFKENDLVKQYIDYYFESNS